MRREHNELSGEKLGKIAVIHRFLTNQPENSGFAGLSKAPVGE
jgi:hypothetical protein